MPEVLPAIARIFLKFRVQDGTVSADILCAPIAVGKGGLAERAQGSTVQRIPETEKQRDRPAGRRVLRSFDVWKRIPGSKHDVFIVVDAFSFPPWFQYFLRHIPLTPPSFISSGDRVATRRYSSARSMEFVHHALCLGSLRDLRALLPYSETQPLTRLIMESPGRTSSIWGSSDLRSASRMTSTSSSTEVLHLERQLASDSRRSADARTVETQKKLGITKAKERQEQRSGGSRVSRASMLAACAASGHSKRYNTKRPPSHSVQLTLQVPEMRL